MVKKTTAKDGDHVVTMREVAKAAGVSIKTVSNVVNDYEFVSDATRAKVHKAIDELGYVINVSARNLRRGSTGIIALAIPDLQLSYFAQLSSLIITEAKKLGLRVIVEPTLYSREGELDALHGSQTAMVDGLIYSPLELGPDDAAEVEVDYPLVLIGERIFTDKVDHIATENVEGAKRATSYLLQTGCKRVAVVGVHPGEEVGSAALRFRGYREALEEAGVPFDPALVVPSIMWHRNDGVAAIWYPQEDGYGNLILPTDEAGAPMLYDFAIYGYTTGLDYPEGWEPSGDDWWWPPTELGLADTSWLCDSWVLELRGGDAGPEYAGTADLYYSPAGYIKQDYLGVWRMEDDCLYLKLSADSGDEIDASFPILISPSGEDLYFQRSRTGAGIPFLPDGTDSVGLLLYTG